MKRYQDCGFFQKLWRQRYTLKVPIDCVLIWTFTLPNQDLDFSMRNCWNIACGLRDMKMNHVYDMDDEDGLVE